MRMLDLFCGRWGWSKSFALRGWECVGVDLVRPSETPDGCSFWEDDILELTSEEIRKHFSPDFICASPPCEEFSVHGMKHFHPNAPWPELGIRLFRHTETLCERSGLPYVIENVRPAQKFVGNAVNHCGPFFLWGNAVPPLLHKGITKGIDVGSSKLVKHMSAEEKRTYRAQFIWNQAWSSSKQRKRDTAKAATIPRELASCVADYAERVIEQRAMAR